MSDYYNYYNQKTKLEQNETATNLTSAKAIIEAYNQGVRIFFNVIIENDSFMGENLKGIIFENSRIQADFRNANLKNAVFKNGYVKMSDFRYSNLTNAHFENVNIELAKFTHAIIQDLSFKNNLAFGNNNLQLRDFKKLFLKPLPKGKFYIEDI